METCFKAITCAATGIIVVILLTIIWAIAAKGWHTLSWALISQAPTGDYYMGGGGGIANAVVGSIYLGVGATLLALILSVPVILYLRVYADGSRFANLIRGLLDVLWGVPSIVIGAFGFMIMVYFGMRASLLAGIVTVAMLELPIMIRAIDEAANIIPRELDETAYGLGSTKFETAVRVIGRQVLPGVATGALLAFGRGVGDAASVLFTTGATDNVPQSIFTRTLLTHPGEALSATFLKPASTLPVAIFQLLNTPFEAVQNRAYGAALILVILVLSASILSRVLSASLGKHIIR